MNKIWILIYFSKEFKITLLSCILVININKLWNLISNGKDILRQIIIFKIINRLLLVIQIRVFKWLYKGRFKKILLIIFKIINNQ